MDLDVVELAQGPAQRLDALGADPIVVCDQNAHLVRVYEPAPYLTEAAAYAAGVSNPPPLTRSAISPESAR